MCLKGEAKPGRLDWAKLYHTDADQSHLFNQLKASYWMVLQAS